MTVTLKEARTALLTLQRFLNQLEKSKITKKQMKYIKDLCKQKGKPTPQNLNNLSKEEASRLIDKLRSK